MIDYKTGKFREYNMSKMRFEMYGYKHLVEKNKLVDGVVTHWAQIFLWGIDPDKKPQVVIEEFKGATEKAFYKKIERTREKIHLRLFPKRQCQLCDWCPFQKDCFLEKEEKWKEPI